MRPDQNVQQNNQPNYKDTIKSRPIPQSELDFNLMTTNTEWGGRDIPEDLKEKLIKYSEVKNNAGELQGYRPNNHWTEMGFYTRDFRLANLSDMKGELFFVRYYDELANDFLKDGFIEPFTIALSRSANVLETSQSKGGFLRKRMNTLTQEHYQQELEPKKKNFFGLNKTE